MVDISRIILDQVSCSFSYYNVITMFKVSENAMPCETLISWFARCCFSRSHIMLLVLEQGQLYWQDLIGCTFIFGVGDEQFRHWLSEEIMHIPPVNFIKIVTPPQGWEGWGGEYWSQRDWQLVYLFMLLIKLPVNHIGKLITGMQINTLAR